MIRAVPGEEPARGPWLDFGPRLLAGSDPHLRDHLLELRAWHDGIARETADSAPERSARFRARAAFLSERLADRGWAPEPPSPR